MKISLRISVKGVRKGERTGKKFVEITSVGPIQIQTEWGERRKDGVFFFHREKKRS